MPELPPIFCLTLAEEPHRRAALEEHLASLSLDATYLTGFHGLTLGLRPVSPFNVDEEGGNHYLHISAIGCFLSHLTALRTALATDATEFIILEDDALLCPDFGNCLSALLDHLPKETDIVSLELFETDRAKPGDRINDYCRHIYWPFGSVAIWWRREAAEFALQRLHPISLPYDISLMNLVYPFRHFAVADPPLVQQRSVNGEWISTVQEEKTKMAY